MEILLHLELSPLKVVVMPMLKVVFMAFPVVAVAVQTMGILLDLALLVKETMVV
jgi:hypothetical protein